MKASVGDRIIVKGHRIGEPDRDCEVVEVRGVDDEPPFLVRWEDSDHEALFFPGPDATVHHYGGAVDSKASPGTVGAAGRAFRPVRPSGAGAKDGLQRPG